MGSTLSGEGERLLAADLILANPPFGTKQGGGLPSRGDFSVPTYNKQFAFLQHIYRGLKPGGRAGVVLPDKVLFAGDIGRQIRAALMDKCRLHTLLRLPTGNIKEVWVGDLRANTPQFAKRTPFTLDFMRPFITAYGAKADGSGQRLDQRDTGRFRRSSRQWIAERGDGLDITWLKDDATVDAADLPEPAVLAQAAMQELEHAMAELGAAVDGRAICLRIGPWWR